MFPIPFNFPFRKSNGELSTIGAEISGGGGGGYVLPPATASTLGGIKVGNNLSIDSNGKLDAPAPTPAYELPTASAETLGGVKVGSGLSIDENGVISASGGGGGGGSKYLHIISCTPSGYNFSFMILKDSSTPLTYENIHSYLSSFAESGSKLYPASGRITNDSKAIIGVKRGSESYRLTIVGVDGGTSDINYSTSFTDTVITF